MVLLPLEVLTAALAALLLPASGAAAKASTPAKVKDTEIAIPLKFNAQYNPTAVQLLTDGILKFGLFGQGKDAASYPLLRTKLDLTVANIALGLDLAALISSSTQKKPTTHREKRLLGLNLDLGLDGLLGGPAKTAGKVDLSIGGLVDRLLSVDVDVGVHLGTGRVVDDGWGGAPTTTVTNSQSDNAWFGQISFGTPAQTLTMALDTGSADTVMYSKNCTTCQLNNHTAFDTAASRTYKATTIPFDTAYGDGTQMRGVLGYDSVTLAPASASSSSLAADNQVLALITAKKAGVSASRWDGILGLGPDQLSFVEGNITPLSNVIKAGKLARPLVGVALVKEDKSKPAGTGNGGGEYRWGGINPTYVVGGEAGITYSNVTSAYYWGVDMKEIYYGTNIGFSALMGAADARRCIVDTATTLIYTSDTACQNLHKQITGAQRNVNDGAWYVPCDTSPFKDVFVEIGTRRFGIPKEDLAFRPSGKNDGLCVSGIQGGSSQYTILGDIFIKNHYLVFNYGSTTDYRLTIGIGDRTDVRSMNGTPDYATGRPRTSLTRPASTAGSTASSGSTRATLALERGSHSAAQTA